MQQYRVQLPISAYRGAIIDAIEGSQVLVLCGETGWCAFFIYNIIEKLAKRRVAFQW